MQINWRRVALTALLSTTGISLWAGYGCLKSIDGWRVYKFSDISPTTGAYAGGWDVKAVKVSAADDGGDTYQINVTNQKNHWQAYSYFGQPFMVGRFGEATGKLAIMHVSNITNGLTIVEWDLDILSPTKDGLTVTATATLQDGGTDSVFQGRGHELGFLKTDWAKKPKGTKDGDWLSGQIFWFESGGFRRADADPKYRRLLHSFSDERKNDMKNGALGKPFKWLRISDWRCK